MVLSHQAKRIEDELNREYNNLKFHIQDLENFPGQLAGALRGISPRYEKVLILNGDMPLITKESIGKLIEKDGDINLSVLELENPKGYGSVVPAEETTEETAEETEGTVEETAEEITIELAEIAPTPENTEVPAGTVLHQL